MEYKFRPGARVNKLNPQTVGEELDRINKEYGYLQPSIIIDESVDPKAPLHPAFEWDNTTASHLYREWQARHLIRSITVVKESRDPEPVYVHIRADENSESKAGKYYPVEVVVADKDMFELALKELNDKLMSAKYAVDKLISIAERSGSEKNLCRARMISDRLGNVVELSAVL